MIQKEDKILVSCYAGCQTEDVVKALGLRMADLFIGQPQPKARAKIVKTYDYTDEAGNLLFQVCRLEPKSFRQRHKNGKGDWTWGMTGIRRVLYHLHDIIKGPKVYFVEGEKDCDALWDCGLVATTSPGGANNWKPEYAKYLVGKKVIIIPDNDEAGFAYARDVAGSLMEKSEVACILLGTKDIADWLKEGGDPATLDGMEQDVSLLWNQDKPQYTLEPDGAILSRHKGLVFRAESLRQERTGLHGRLSIEYNYSPLAWSAFNLERAEERTRLGKMAHAHLNSNLKQEYALVSLTRDFDLFCAGLWEFYLSHYTPELLYGQEPLQPLRFALRPYILWGGASILFAPPGRGKSNTALLWAQSINCGVKKFWDVEKAPVLYINLERSAHTITRRLACVNRTLGLPISEPLRILNARGKSLMEVLPVCRRAIKQYGIKATFLDSISRAGYGDLTENRPVNTIIDALSSLCDTWVALGHTPRMDETHVYGGIMFDAGADITIKLSSEATDANTLGIGLEVTKSNDMRFPDQMIWAMEFDENGLIGLRKAKPFEFPEVAGKVKKPTAQIIREFILEQADARATASEIADGTGLNRGNISNMLTHSGQFLKLAQQGKKVYYGVKEAN